jgi:hypothetical protein
MKAILLLAAAILAGGSSGAIEPAKNVALHGDYVEARTASVFAGACHYNGELVTAGKDAVMAWRVTGGTWKGVDLSGVKAVAAVSADANLSDQNASRKSELVVDGTDSQAKAFEEAIRTRYAATLGKVVSVKHATINFTHDSDSGYKVVADGFARCTVDPMPDAACCKQPNLVWYSPLISVQNRKVGFTTDAQYTAGTLGSTWERSGENSAFYGAFSF